MCLFQRMLKRTAIQTEVTVYAQGFSFFICSKTLPVMQCFIMILALTAFGEISSPLCACVVPSFPVFL